MRFAAPLVFAYYLIQVSFRLGIKRKTDKCAPLQLAYIGALRLLFDVQIDVSYVSWPVSPFAGSSCPCRACSERLYCRIAADAATRMLLCLTVEDRPAGCLARRAWRW